jgi:hypothetical protein
MLRYQDFVPKQIQPGFLFGVTRYENFDEAVAAAGDWIAQGEVQVVNVETVVLPALWQEEGSADPEVCTPANVNAYWYQFIRVWYHD